MILEGRNLPASASQNQAFTAHDSGMFLEGGSWRVISERLGISVDTACQAIQEANRLAFSSKCRNMQFFANLVLK
jgi:hypothetical protein